MIPTCDSLVEAYAFVARRQNLEERARRSPVPIPLPLRADPIAIAAALRAVDAAVDDGIHPAAALLYAFARYPRCFPLALFAMATLIAKNAARDEGFVLEASADELRKIIGDVTTRECSRDDVDGWVRDRLVPMTSPQR